MVSLPGVTAPDQLDGEVAAVLGAVGASGSDLELLKARSDGADGWKVYVVRARPAGQPSIVLKRARHVATEAWLGGLAGEVGVRVPRVLDTVVPGPGRPTWLVMEDLGDPGPGAVRAGQQDAARWLAHLHAAGRRLEALDLPDRGLAPIRQGLQEAVGPLSRSLAPGILPPAHAATMRSLLTSLEVVDEHWARVVACAERERPTLVHGDVQRKHFRGRGEDFTLIDWEMAGWGPPLLDCSSAVDLPTYWVASGGGVAAPQAAAIGRVVALVRAVRWACGGLPAHGRSLHKLIAYAGHLRREVTSLGWRP